MALRATFMPGTSKIRDIAVGPFMDPASQVVIDTIYQGCGPGVLECREHDSDPKFTHLRGSDGRVHGAWLYVQKRNKKTLTVLCHNGQSCREEFQSLKCSVAVGGGKSDGHQYQQDYYCRAVDGIFPADQEDGTAVPGRVLDVRIDGDVGPVGFEVQCSFRSVPYVRNKTRDAERFGVPLVWSADKKGPAWAFKAPHIEANVGLPGPDARRGTWTVTTGPRRISRVKCELWNTDRLPKCWKPGRQGRIGCGEYHPAFTPMTGLVVDTIARWVPAGLLVPLDTDSKQGVILTPKSDYELWQNEFADLPRPQTRERNDARPCSYQPNLQGHAVSADDGLPRELWLRLARGYDR